MTPVRVRFAPAPSGSLHVGNARSALFNWLFARHHGGAFVLRIEDTDPSRAKEEFIASLMDVLRWLGIDWDEGPDVGGPHAPYRQSQRFDRYRHAAARMIEAGEAYRCWCTPEELEERRRAALAAGKTPGYDGRCRELSEAERAAFEAEGRAAAVRFRVRGTASAVQDTVHGEVHFDHEQIADFVILRSGGTPTYLLAAAHDDLDMRITHVIRGEDLLPSTPRQMMLYEALGAPREAWPRFAHLPLIVGPDRKPLSKRSGDVSLEHYRDNGFLPEAVLNYLALLGWSPGDGVTERFTAEELVAAFDLAGVTRNPAAFDAEKLTALNGEKIRALDPEDLAARLEPFLVRDGVLADPPTPEQRALLRRIVPLIRERLDLLTHAAEQVRFFFSDVEPDEKARALLARADTLPRAAEVLQGVGSWETPAIEAALRGWVEAAAMSKKQVKEAFQAVRAAVTGRTVTPPLFESLEILGRERSLERIRAAVAG